MPHTCSSLQLAPHLCRTGHQSLWGISTAWVKSMKKSRRVSNGSEPESPLAGVNQELAGTMFERQSFVLFVKAPWLTKVCLFRNGPYVYCLVNCVGCSTAQHSTAQHSTAQHSTAQHSTAQHSTAQHSTAQPSAIPNCKEHC